MDSNICRLKEQGFSQGACLVEANGEHLPACQVTLKYKSRKPYRLITAIHLSRPENYLSIYQSGCNFSCRKCHSWYFSKVKNGAWYSPDDIWILEETRRKASGENRASEILRFNIEL